MRYPVKLKFEGIEITGDYTLTELIGKLEEILNGTDTKKEKEER